VGHVRQTWGGTMSPLLVVNEPTGSTKLGHLEARISCIYLFIMISYTKYIEYSPSSVLCTGAFLKSE